MNYRALCSALVREVGIGGGHEVPTVIGQIGELARVVGWISQANADIQSLYFDWKFLWSANAFDTVAGVSSYAPPSDCHFYERDRARIANVRGVSVVEHELWEGYDDGVTGQPHTIILMPDGGIQLYPAPDEVYSVSLPYYRAPQILRENNDIPWIPEAYHDLIWMRAIIKYGYYEAAPEMLQRVQAEYPARLASLESNQLPTRYRYALAHDPEPVVVIPQ